MSFTAAPGRRGASPTPPGLPVEACRGASTTAATAAWTQRRAELRLLERWVPTVFAGRHVLEVGAGTGHWTRFIAPHTSSLLATDPAEHRLAVARQRVHSAKARFAAADALSLPAHLGRFDAAFAGFWVSQLPPARLLDFFTSLHARLEPGAKVLLLDHRGPGAAEPEGAAGGTVERLLRSVPSGDELLHRLGGVARRPVLHQWAFYWAVCYEIASSAS